MSPTQFNLFMGQGLRLCLVIGLTVVIVALAIYNSIGDNYISHCAYYMDTAVYALQLHCFLDMSYRFSKKVIQFQKDTTPVVGGSKSKPSHNVFSGQPSSDIAYHSVSRDPLADKDLSPTAVAAPVIVAVSTDRSSTQLLTIEQALELSPSPVPISHQADAGAVRVDSRSRLLHTKSSIELATVPGRQPPKLGRRVPSRMLSMKQALSLDPNIATAAKFEKVAQEFPSSPNPNVSAPTDKRGSTIEFGHAVAMEPPVTGYDQSDNTLLRAISDVIRDFPNEPQPEPGLTRQDSTLSSSPDCSPVPNLYLFQHPDSIEPAPQRPSASPAAQGKGPWYSHSPLVPPKSPARRHGAFIIAHLQGLLDPHTQEKPYAQTEPHP
ncbi:hypothetical protein HDU91_003313, partial [Kappamyces sp. JEL0680]